jgi:hypothetical protein
MKSELKIAIAAFAASLVAIILSQFHPLYTYLDKPRLAAELSRLEFYQAWGKIGVGAFVELSNDGRAAGRISRIDVFIEREHDALHSIKLEVQNYYPIPPNISIGSVATQVPWSPVTLAPDGNWDYWVNCYATPNDTDMALIDELTAETQRQIAIPAGAPVAGAAPRVIDDALFQRISTFANTNLAGFSGGAYFAVVEFWTEKPEASLMLKAYSFSVPSSYERLFSTGIAQFKYGTGILFPSQLPQGPVVSLVPVSDQITIDALKKDFAIP